MGALANLDWTEILEQLKKAATSDVAKVRLEKLAPLETPELAQSHCLEVLETQQVLSIGARPFMESLDLFSTWFVRLQKEATLKPLELRDVRFFCLETLALAERLSQTESNWLRDIQKKLMNATEPLSAIDQLMAPTGEIRSDASEKLYNLHKEKESTARQVQSTLDRLVKDHDMEGLLQDKYVTTREGRWVLPVKGGMQHHLPGIIHAASQSKQTVFMEPEAVIPINNRLREIDVELDEEIERLLSEMTAYLYTLIYDFEKTRGILEHMDIRLAQATLSQQIDGQPCQFDDEYVDLREVRHPLLVLASGEVVANGVYLDMRKSILLLSGPNAGGKTVLLKSVGLAAHMARCGLPIAAESGSKLPFFENLVVAIGDSQSVDAHLSTFAAHLKILDESSKYQGSKTLLLIDEICGSTDPEEGSALARSFIETYAKNQVFGVITSHLGPLKAGWEKKHRVVNGSMEYDQATGQPTYQFLLGVPGESLALQTARRAGVSEPILDRAYEVLSPETRARHQGMEEIESIKTEMQALRKRLEQESRQAQSTKKKYDRLVKEFKREKDERLSQTVKKAEKKLDQFISHAKVDQLFKKHSTAEDVKRKLPEVVKLSPRSIQEQKITTVEDFGKSFPPGSKVFVSSLGRDGIVQGTPNNKGEVSVLAGSIRLSLSWKDLRSPQKAQNPTADLVRKSSHFQVSLNESDRSLDLRGSTVEEAIEELEVALDRAVQNNEERIKIVHGHGTEALKRAVRSHLSRSTYVRKWKAGSPETGGDGVTWVELGG